MLFQEGRIELADRGEFDFEWTVAHVEETEIDLMDRGCLKFLLKTQTTGGALADGTLHNWRPQNLEAEVAIEVRV